MRIWAIAALVATGRPALAQDAVDIAVEHLGPDARRATLTLKGTTDPTTAQALVASIASQACGGRAATLGEFRFSATEKIGEASPRSITLVQDIACGASPPGPAPSAATTWRAGPADEAEVRRMFDRFWDRSSPAAAAAAHALLSPDADPRPRDEWIAQALRDARQEGPVVGAPRLKLTWYYDPPDVAPGAYVAVDFRRATRDVAVDCGYVAFRRDPAGGWRVVRTERGTLTRQVAAEMTPAIRDQSIAALRCRLD
jgi:hypothetical protein